MGVARGARRRGGIKMTDAELNRFAAEAAIAARQDAKLPGISDSGAYVLANANAVALECLRRGQEIEELQRDLSDCWSCAAL